MEKLLLCLAVVPSSHDAADALAVAICHMHSMAPAGSRIPHKRPRTWRQYRPPTHG